MRFSARKPGRLLAAALLALAACSPPAESASVPAVSQSTPPATPRAHPLSGLEIIALTVTSEDGKAHQFAVEVARTAMEQARGLMFREAMGANEGMIFPNDPPQMRSFWMRNTVLPLDLIFVGPDHRIVNIAADAVPYSEATIPSASPVIAVLEINGSRAAELGIKPGDRVDWDLPLAPAAD